MHLDNLKNVLVLGAGSMGQQISLLSAIHGYRVALYDIHAEMLDQARILHQSLLPELAKFFQKNAEGILERIEYTNVPENAAKQADLLIEAVPENPTLKAQVFAQFHQLCPEHTLFATNTSSFIPSMFADASGRPERFAALHFHLPIWLANVVDIMPHSQTAPETIKLLEAFARSIGQIPIVYQNESHGYILNAMLGAIQREALALVMKNVASFEQVDRAWMGVMKMSIGPFGIMDSVGLDTVHTIMEFWANTLSDSQGLAQASYLKGLLDQGRLGVKSGHGFYSYPNPSYQQPGFVSGLREADV